MTLSKTSEMPYSLIVNIEKQMLFVFCGNAADQIKPPIKKYRIATAKNGAGEQFGSECTPRGAHIIRAKIGSDVVENTVFVGRRPTGEVYNSKLKRENPQRDWILTRILWLSGKEPGNNRLANVDTMRRYVYIHGCPDEDEMGVPSSHGCIKMRNTDIIELFTMVPPYTSVNIIEGKEIKKT